MPGWLVIASATVLLYVVLWYRKRLRYFSDRGAPFVPPDNLLGSNVNSLTKKNIYLGDVYRKMYHDYKGHEYVGFFSLLSPTVLIIDPRLVEEVLTRDFASFDDHGLPLDEEDNPLEANLFFLSGPRWRALRRKLTPTFTSGKLKGMFPLVEECTDHLIRIVSARVRGGEGQGEQEVRDLLARFTTDVIGSCAFGMDAGSLADPDSEFRRMGKKFFDPSGWDKLLTVLRFTVPSLVKKLRLKRGYREDETFFIDLVRRGLAVRAAAADRGEGDARQDFLHLLLQLKTLGSVSREPADLEELGEDQDRPQEATTTIEFTDNLLAAQAFVFFLAGFETTASAISFTLYLLSKEPEAQRRLREELRRAKAVHGRINYDVLSAAPFLDRCLRESMRLYPPIELLPRTCTRDYRMKDGFLVEKGTRVVVPVVALHHDPELWSEPEAFRPERFESPPPPGAYLPFGGGPRTCIAQRFALLEAKLCIAKLIDSFEISLSAKTEDPLRLSTHTFVVVPSGGIWLRFEPLP